MPRLAFAMWLWTVGILTSILIVPSKPFFLGSFLLIPYLTPCFLFCPFGVLSGPILLFLVLAIFLIALDHLFLLLYPLLLLSLDLLSLQVLTLRLGLLPA